MAPTGDQHAYAPAAERRGIPAARAPWSARPHLAREAAPEPVRRVTDDLGRTWRVREMSPRTSAERRRILGLIFSCDVPGPVPELRCVCRPLGQLQDTELLDLLQRADY